MDVGAPRDPIEIEERQWAGMVGDVAYDIGSNMGQSVAKMLAVGFKSIWAFEPADESFAVLERNYGGDARVRLSRLAISNHNGMLSLSVREAPIMTGQLVAEGMPYRSELPSDPTMARWGRDLSTRQLACAKLDSILSLSNEPAPIPDFVKVDTEGHELQVITGALEFIQAKHARWLIEFHREDLMHGCANILHAFGYQVEILRHPHYTPHSHMWLAHGWIRAIPLP